MKVGLPRTAVILAAGMGTRLKGLNRDKPKGLMEVGGRVLMERSFRLLLEAGVQRILVVTGYRAECYREFCRGYPEARCLLNENYRDTGSMLSLFIALNETEDDFLLLESDLVYEKRALSVLADFPPHDAVLISGRTNSGDEVYVSERNGGVGSMSKRPEELENIAGELVGICKISKSLGDEMKRYADAEQAKNPGLCYETDVLAEIGKTRSIPLCREENLIWAEIDDESHLRRVRELVVPSIVGTEGAL